VEATNFGAKFFWATSTVFASTFPYASTTGISTTNLCLGATCYTAMPGTTYTAGSGVTFNGGTTIGLISYLATSTADTANQVPYFSTTNAVPAKISGNAAFTFNPTGTLLTATNASTTLFASGTIWNSGLTANQIIATDANKKEVSTSTIGWYLLQTIAANSVLGNVTGTAATGASVATSSLFTWGTGLTSSANTISLASGWNPVAIVNGGTNATSLSGANALVAMNAGNSALSIPSTSYTETASLLTAPNASTTNFSAGSSNLFNIFASGEAVAYDNQTGTAGQVSPMRYISLQLSTSSAWTASSSASSVYGDEAIVVMPFAGTLRTISCWTNAGTLEISATVNGGTANYLPASTTAGTYTLSSTFTKGATTTFIGGAPASSPTIIPCTIGVTQTQ
jgi:hypothetical protein